MTAARDRDQTERIHAFAGGELLGPPRTTGAITSRPARRARPSAPKYLAAAKTAAKSMRIASDQFIAYLNASLSPGDSVAAAEYSAEWRLPAPARSAAATTAGSEDKPLVVLHLRGGATLAATELHAILLSTGTMVAAKDLLVGQRLVQWNGAQSTIEAITRVATSDDVFNVLTNAGMSHKGHMIVACAVRYARRVF